MNSIALAMVISVSVEALLQYLSAAQMAAQQKDYRQLGQYLLGLALGIALCASSGTDVYTALGVRFGMNWVGTLLTGIFVSRGADYFAAILQKLQAD